MSGLPFDPEEEDRNEASAFLSDYRLRHLVTHLAAAGDRARLFHLLESTPHLAHQAERFERFELCVADLLDRVLPAAIAEADWSRFLRFAATALHLSGLAYELAEPELLGALAQSGRTGLAGDTARRLPDPWLRVEALAAVAAGAGSGHPLAAQEALALLRDTIDGTQLPRREPARSFALERLRSAARRAGPEIGERWHTWLAALPTQEARALRCELAEAWLARGDPAAAGLWRALAATGEEDRPALARQLGAISKGRERESRDRLRRVPTSRRCEIAFLVGVARRDAETALDLVEELNLSGSDFPDAMRVDEAQFLLDHLPATEIDRLAADSPTREARAALTAVALAREPGEVRIAAARAAVERLEESRTRLDAALRYLAARPASPERVRQLAAVADWLEEGRFAAPAATPDLVRRFLDLAAVDLANRAAAFLDAAAFAPGAGVGELLRYARELAAEPLLERLIDQAETYADAVAPHAGASFSLRAEIRIEAAARLCQLRGDLRGLALAAPLLLLEEEDELRLRLARSWAPTAADPDERERRAVEVCDGLRDRRRRLLGRIAASPPERFPGGDLSSTALYASLADPTALTAEIGVLAALGELPLDPAEIAERLLLPLPRGARSSALLALAEHAIAFEEATYGDAADRGTALALLRSALAFDSDRALAAATPEVAALGAAGSPALAALEIEEAARRLAGLVEISWSDRRAALARLFAALPRILRARGRRAARQAKGVARSLALLPVSLPPGPAREELRAGWTALAPILTAAVERMTPVEAAASPRPPEGFVRALEAGFCEPRTDLERAVLEVCLATVEERGAQITRALAAAGGELPTAEPAVLVLLAPLRPNCAAALARLWPAGEERDAACLFLLRERWLDGEAGSARALAKIVSEGAARAEAFAWATLDEPDTDWLEHFGAWIAAGARPPGEPDLTPLRHRLWRADSAASREALARRFAEALRTEGRSAAETALRWFLHAHLSPVLGDESPAAVAENPISRQTLDRALRLPGDPPATGGTPVSP